MAKFRRKYNFKRKKFKKYKRGKVARKVKKYVKSTISKMTPTATINFGDLRTYNQAGGDIQVNSFTINNVLEQGVDDVVIGGFSGAMRIGSRVKMIKFKLKAWVHFPAYTTDSDNRIAYMICLYKNPAGFGQTLKSTANNIPVNAQNYMSSSEGTLPARFLDQLQLGNPESLLSAMVDDRYADVIWERRGIMFNYGNITNTQVKQYWFGGNKKVPKYMTFNIPNDDSLQVGNMFMGIYFIGETVSTFIAPIICKQRIFMQFKSVAQHQDMQ